MHNQHHIDQVSRQRRSARAIAISAQSEMMVHMMAGSAAAAAIIGVAATLMAFMM